MSDLPYLDLGEEVGRTLGNVRIAGDLYPIVEIDVARAGKAAIIGRRAKELQDKLRGEDLEEEAIEAGYALARDTVAAHVPDLPEEVIERLTPAQFLQLHDFVSKVAKSAREEARERIASDPTNAAP